jgi:preprotein translocase subunit SecE
MADVAVAQRENPVARFVSFVREAFHEVRHKTTWPDRAQILQATWAILAFVLVIGAVIGLMDILLNYLLVRIPTSLVR